VNLRGSKLPWRRGSNVHLRNLGVTRCPARAEAALSILNEVLMLIRLYGINGIVIPFDVGACEDVAERNRSPDRIGVYTRLRRSPTTEILDSKLKRL
jgi:hypothetical protein